MWNYSEKMMDHFRNPRNVGKIDNPDGTATVGSLACGDALQFQFKLGPDGKIAEAKFQTFGCASAIASSSALTEMVIGKTLDEAKKITNQQIADYLGGLPPQKMHCSVMGREAMEAAIKNFETGKNTDRNLEDTVLCTCYNVSENEVRRVITRGHQLHEGGRRLRPVQGQDTGDSRRNPRRRKVKIGFDNDKYLKEQSEEIRRRAGKYGRLYLEFGGKLMNDFHAARCLPGYHPLLRRRRAQAHRRPLRARACGARRRRDAL